MNFRQYIWLVCLFHFFVYLAVALDIPVIRQIATFAYLIFIPGFVFLSFLRINKIRLLDVLLFSVGLSVALLMFVGLFVNEFLPTLGISQPLSTAPILLAVSGFTIVFFAASCTRDISGFLSSITLDRIKDKVETVPVAVTLLLLMMPIFSVMASVFVREAIPVLPIVIIALFVVSVLSLRLVPAKLYPLLIFSVSLSLVLQFPFMTKHIVGADSPLEYFVYKIVAINNHWVPSNIGTWPQPAFNSMLSITILPTIYSSLLNVDGELLFKVLFPFIFSIVPVTVYRLLDREGKSRFALLSAFFLVSSPLVFYGIEPLGLNRQLIGAFFLVLSLFLLVERPFSKNTNRLIMLILGAALVVSHYTFSIIFLLFIVLAYVFVRATKKPENILDGGVILLLLSMNLLWYWYIPNGIIDKLLSITNNIMYSFGTDVLNPGSRPNEIFTTHSVRTVASSVNWALFAVVHAVLFLGILAVVLNRTKYRFDFKYRAMILFSSILLLLAILVPNLSATLNFVRYYGITLLFLASCFVIGGDTLLFYLKKITERLFKPPQLPQFLSKIAGKKIDFKMLLLVVLIGAYFLSQYGFINHFAGGSPQSYTLDWDNMRTSTDPGVKLNLYFCFTPEEDIVSANWLSKSVTNNSLIYSDWMSQTHPLKIYALIPDANLLTLTNYTRPQTNSFIYLRYFNVIDGFITPTPEEVLNYTQIDPILRGANLAYTNGGSQVYFAP